MVAINVPVRIRPSILLFGDSITQQGYGWTTAAAAGDASSSGSRYSLGWSALLSHDYSRRADVLNRGFSGYNTRHALELLPRILPRNDVAACTRETSADNAHQGSYTSSEVLFATIFFGANDATMAGEQQHVPLDEYGQNLRQMVDYMRGVSGEERHCEEAGENTKAELAAEEQISENECHETENSKGNGDGEILPIILFTPPPIAADKWYSEHGDTTIPEANRTYDRTNDNAKRYGDIVKQVAADKNCSVLDVFNLLGGNGPEEHYERHLRDGLHLSESGNVLLYEGLMDLIGRDMPHLRPMTDGQGRYGEVGSGLPLEEKLWGELC